MSATGFDATVQETNRWLKIMMGDPRGSLPHEVLDLFPESLVRR